MSSIRARIDTALEEPLNEAEWRVIQNRGYLLRLQRGEITPDGIAADWQQLRQATSHREPALLRAEPKLKGNPARVARAELLSYLFTRMASLMDFVVSYRKDILHGQLLSIDAVEEWILQMVNAEGITAWAKIPRTKRFSAEAVNTTNWDIERQCFLDNSGISVSISDAVEIEYRWLEYLIPGRASKSVPTSAGGGLERLRVASERLASQTACHPSEASIFILTGHPLPAYPCSRAIEYCDLPALNRIKLNIDPTLSPREVSNIYREMRVQIFRRRYRAMSEKHIRLALFAWSRSPQGRLKEAMAAWNKQFPKWRYRAESNYGRDSVVARRRALETLNAPSASKADVDEWAFSKSDSTHKGGKK